MHNQLHSLPGQTDGHSASVARAGKAGDSISAVECLQRYKTATRMTLYVRQRIALPALGPADEYGLNDLHSRLVRIQIETYWALIAQPPSYRGNRPVGAVFEEYERAVRSVGIGDIDNGKPLFLISRSDAD
ncbi:hypothetical protein EYR40_002171 [Pleurotus pulmonarius]|nr:hypothetical protein EYR36_002338 [Pleurotus pulmonarius]KAF4583680.1 hypothetical protein EYR40_002171 [Pleurotus pulmonarius]